MTKVKSKIVNQNPDELRGYISHIIENNNHLQSKGQPAVAVEIIGESGIGKTSIIEQLARDRDMDYVKINLAQIGEEVSELVGYPIRQFEMIKEQEKLWVDEPAIESYRGQGYATTGANRTGYCPPEWIARINGRPGIFNLDDWTRGSIRTIQAVMEIISRQEYISWKLPKGWTVVLTANPNDGNYLVNETDEAQKSRYISANLTFDADCWGRYAEQIGLDSRCINFLLMHPELVTKECNPRSITTFFNSISSFKSFDDSLPMIQMIGEGSVGVEFSTMFTLFVNNKLDKLIGPKEMLTGPWKEVKLKMQDCIGTGKNYRADIASVLATRVGNYAAVYANDNPITKAVTDRIVSLSTEDILQDDIKFNLVKGIINSEHKAKFAVIMSNKNVVRMAIK